MAFLEFTNTLSLHTNWLQQMGMDAIKLYFPSHFKNGKLNSKATFFIYVRNGIEDIFYERNAICLKHLLMSLQSFAILIFLRFLNNMIAFALFLVKLINIKLCGPTYRLCSFIILLLPNLY